VFMTNNSISNVGGGKRNKSGAMLYLHGVQDTDLVKNAFSDSKPIIIEHTVGEPQTLIEQNVFKNVTQPRVTELFTGGESTAVLLDNTYTNK
jgi:poly(beta-D-mannuronate) lyase